MIADILGDRMGCFLFQMPPSYRYTKTRLNDIVSQLDPGRRNVVEFRHASWWNEEVYEAFRTRRDYLLLLQRATLAGRTRSDER